MRIHLIPVFLAVLLPSFSGCTTPAKAPIDASVKAEPTGTPIDRVWSGHPVGFSLLTERGHQFIAYYDAERRITVVGRRLDQNEWQRFQPPGVPVPRRGRDSNMIAWDSHNYLTLVLDRDGFLHLSGNMHVDPLVYYRSTRPFDVTSFERLDRMTGKREDRVTYPIFVKNIDGDLFFRYRDGSSGNGVDIYNRYDCSTRTWQSLLSSPLLDGERKRNAYATVPRLGPDGRFHMIWVWRDTPDCSTNHSLSYARSRDLVNWEKSDGTPLKLPITLATSEIIDPSPVKGGLINTTKELGFDQKNRPVVVYHRYDEVGRSQAYAAHPSAESKHWKSVQISDWDFRWDFSGGGSIVVNVSLNAPKQDRDNTLLVDYTTAYAPGSGRLRLDSATLRPLAVLPPIKPAISETPADSSGMLTRSVESRADGRRWVLRWETLPENRDLPRDAAPPPSAMVLYELPDS